MTALARRTIVTSIAGLPLAAILADPRLAIRPTHCRMVAA